MDKKVTFHNRGTSGRDYSRLAIGRYYDGNKLHLTICPRDKTNVVLDKEQVKTLVENLNCWLGVEKPEKPDVEGSLC